MAQVVKVHTIPVSPAANPTAASANGIQLVPPAGATTFVRVLEPPMPGSNGTNTVALAVLWSS